MALVLIEGENKIPSILGASNFTSTTKDPQFNSVKTSSASGQTTIYVFHRGLVMCIVTLLAALF